MPFGARLLGVSASPALLPPGSSTAGGAGPSDQPLRTPDDVIAAHLVPFRDIAEMQQKNAQPLRTIRALTQAHEAAPGRGRSVSLLNLSSVSESVQSQDTKTDRNERVKM